MNNQDDDGDDDSKKKNKMKLMNKQKAESFKYKWMITELGNSKYAITRISKV